MNCDEYKNLITIGVFGELTKEELSRLKTHLRDCPACSALYEKSEKLSDLADQDDDIPLPDRERSWQIISAKALKKKRMWFDRFVLPKPVFQYALVLLLLGAGFAAGYFFRSDRLKGSQLARLQQEISQIREITAASLVRQESLNLRLRNIGMSTPMTQGDKISLEYLLRSWMGTTGEDIVTAESIKTTPLVDLALTLVRQIDQSQVY
jgi:hypothetical protein